MNPFYKLTHLFLRVIFRFLFNLKITGSKNIPRKGGVLILSNHSSNLDPPIIAVSLFREVYFLAKAELFKFKLLKDIFSSLNAFPIKRNAVDRQALANCFQILKIQKVLLLFPEGTRSKDGKLQQGQVGAGMIIAKAKKEFGAIIIPAYIKDSFKMLPWGKYIIKPGQVQVRFGPSIEYSEEILSNLNKESYQKIINITMEKINNLGKIE
ncbi:1-acyl-sn-glycerol-3-phosphate acyltransferase [bacterium]|nr:1-acyl-sn-glycerol-3-phosphate acyltransferase [bacterium]MBU1153643.1 1-acyl-sn-glycerol-3-phosphate acyltransferase [bacterium]MBU1782416.1 1-acyl-sn-glycerol-3-phosphate acyltransferase [bacterium]MBU2599438.1 1-acyl-sn-glycerol-3-phosphate acyltransferase [bacterium]